MGIKRALKNKRIGFNYVPKKSGLHVIQQAQPGHYRSTLMCCFEGQFSEELVTQIKEADILNTQKLVFVGFDVSDDEMSKASQAFPNSMVCTDKMKRIQRLTIDLKVKKLPVFLYVNDQLRVTDFRYKMPKKV